MRASRGNLFKYWGVDSNDRSMTHDDLGADPDTDVMMPCDNATEDGLSNGSISNGKPPSITHSTAFSEPFNVAEILRLLAELLRFANWAFGPNGLPTLQVLAFGDFSYNGRSHIHNKLFCRHTRSIRNPENDISQQTEDELILTFRLVIENDTKL